MAGSAPPASAGEASATQRVAPASEASSAIRSPAPAQRPSP
ncbi:MAG TPA: hypothetical protein PK082_08320 [Phycisphaerae bacterium]|nr:hypothetical protein [Phycisphaerae bacterium]